MIVLTLFQIFTYTDGIRVMESSVVNNDPERSDMTTIHSEDGRIDMIFIPNRILESYFFNIIFGTGLSLSIIGLHKNLHIYG